jgi:predicted ArsR family transcriptional regulator
MDRKYDVFAAIGDPTRRQILMLLAAGSMSINTLAQNFEISRPAISRHVKLLEQAGLIELMKTAENAIVNWNPQVSTRCATGWPSTTVSGMKSFPNWEMLLIFM